MLKRVSLSCVVLSIVLGLVLPATAQEAQEITFDEYIELVRTDVKKNRVSLLGQAMNFSADEAVAFWPIYKEYEAEFIQLGDARLALIKDYAADYTSMTNAKAGELAHKAMNLERARMELRHKYIQRIEQEMSPIVAARFLQAESQINLLLDLQLAQQLPLIQKTQ